jgi:isoleucyl-tRNA synthetase
MSKSLGNTIEPGQVIKESGAEILRLWSTMVDFREEVRIGPEIIARVVEAYRKIRNTARILVANLYDFNPAFDMVDVAKLPEIDRYALARYADTGVRILQAYDQYEFPTFFHALNALATVDLSAFYVDVSKDRLYTLAPASPSRRAAQTALYVIADGLARLMAPVLPVTADELWRALPGAREESVHLAEFPRGLEALVDAPLVQRWARLIRVRDEVNQAIERQRKDKVIGNSRAARLAIRASGEIASLLEHYRDDLPMIFIVSEVGLEPVASTGVAATSGTDRPQGSEAGDLTIQVTRATGVKCDRCWRFVPEVFHEAPHEGICDRCVGAMTGQAGG